MCVRTGHKKDNRPAAITASSCCCTTIASQANTPAEAAIICMHTRDACSFFSRTSPLSKVNIFWTFFTNKVKWHACTKEQRCQCVEFVLPKKPLISINRVAYEASKERMKLDQVESIQYPISHKDFTKTVSK